MNLLKDLRINLLDNLCPQHLEISNDRRPLGWWDHLPGREKVPPVVLWQAVQTIHILKHLLCRSKQDVAFGLRNGRQRIWHRFPAPCILAVDSCFELCVIAGPHRLADGNILAEVGNQFCLRFGCAGGVTLTGTRTRTTAATSCAATGTSTATCTAA